MSGRRDMLSHHRAQAPSTEGKLEHLTLHQDTSISSTPARRIRRLDNGTDYSAEGVRSGRRFVSTI
jgi:hypothetical protein